MAVCIVDICFNEQAKLSDQFCKEHYNSDIEGNLGLCTSRGCSKIIDRNLYRKCSDCIN
mgnify:FL=1